MSEAAPRRITARALRHPLRAILMAGAAVCAVSGLAGAAGVVAAAIGAALGAVAGELAGRSRLRLWLVAAAAALVALGGTWLAVAATRYELVPDLVGPSRALRLSAVLRFGALALAGATLLRAGARRVPALAAIELAAVAAALVIPFAAHRGGVIARPLWLSDWAWQKGIDPAAILFAIGAGAACLLMLLQALESARRLSAATLALPALILLAVGLIRYAPPAPPPATSEHGTSTIPDRSNPPRTPPKPPDVTGPGVTASTWGQPGTGQGQGGTGAQPQGGGAVPSGGQDQGQGGGDAQAPPDLTLDGEGRGDAAVAIVLLGDDVTPRSQMYYFRQEAWSEFAGNRLVASRRRGVDDDVPRVFASGRVESPRPSLDGDGQVVHADVALLASQRRPFFLGTPLVEEPLANPNPARFVRAYRFEGLVVDRAWEDLLGREAGDPDWPPEVREVYLRPPYDDRYAALAAEIVAALPEERRQDPFARAAAVKLWLDKNLIYSTKHRHAGVADPTSDFLFGDRTGYCVHFAHAAVYLFRSLGIPARIGTGYAVQVEHGRGSEVLIRGADAHAWPELHLRGAGWVVLDIAAERNLDPPGAPPDEDLRRLFAEMARNDPPDPYEAPGAGRPRTRWGAIGAGAAGGLLLLALVTLYAWKGWRRLAPRVAAPRALPRVAYRRALDRLAELGRTRAPGETRKGLARRLAELPAFARMTELHLAARFAPPGPPPPREAWRTLEDQLGAELAGAATRRRRLLAALDPVSFLLSR